MYNVLGDFLRRQAERSPEKDCQVFGENRYTYGWLNKEANRLANAFLNSGLGPGDHVGIYSSNCIEYLIAFWGAAKAGVVLVHLNSRLTENELSSLIQHAEAKVLFFHEDSIEKIEKAKYLMKRADSLRWICIGSRCTVPWAMNFSSFVEDGEIQEPSKLRQLLIREDDPLVMLYTSGTEGFPKGVLMSHRQRISISMQQFLWFTGQREKSYRFLNALPFFHMVAQTYIPTLVMMRGTGFQVFPFDPEVFLKTIEKERITSLILVPTIIKRLLDHPLFARTDLSSLEIIRYGAEPLDPATREAMMKGFPNVCFSEGLGQTEMGTPIYQLEDDFITHPTSAGRPDCFCDVEIIKESGQTAELGEVGEIVVRTPSLMLGYYKDPEATQAFFKYGLDWGCTGDMGFMDKEGFVTTVSRSKDMYISGGENVYPVEIENMLCTHPSVVEAAVVGVPDKTWGEVGAAAIVLRHGRQVTEEEILKYASEKLAKFKCPKFVKFYKTLPKTPLGKVIKGNLVGDF